MSGNINKMPRWLPLLLVVLVLLAIKLNDDKGPSNAGDNADNTTPIGVQQSETAEDVLAAVPAELRNNFFLQQKEKGCCKTLSGDVAVTVIMVSDSVGVWDETSETDLKSALETSGQDIVSQAAEHQVELSFSFHYYNVVMTGDVCNGENNDGWQEEALQKADLSSLDNLHNHLTEKYDSKEAPVVFVFNKPGRSFARSGSSEFFILYAEKDMHAFQHELSHIFGAKDYYYPKEVKALASEFFEDSIMNGGETVDSLTAYLIGWSDTASEEALQFLRDTNEITTEQMLEANKDELITGYGTKEFDSGTYTGDLLRGERHGTGTMEYDNGGWYTGEWSYGGWSGTGTGKYIYKDGGSYEGNFLNGERHGQGTYTYPNGAVYTGQWAAGEKSGTGTMRYSDGSWYTGNWNGSDLVGKSRGKAVYENGTYEGEFLNGKRHGQGTYTYNNGGWLTGTWSNGDQTGAATGKKVYNNGTYEGEFLNGKRHGQGTYAWTSGEKYTGQWANGERHGYGIYTYADGRVRTGNWNNGKFAG